MLQYGYRRSVYNRLRQTFRLIYNSIFVLFILFTGLIYIVDSNDRERLQEARDELHGILDSDEMRGVPVVVIANKQDLPSKCLIMLHSSKCI